MPSERILVCGAGVAGSIVAYWLAKHDYQVTVVERSKANQKLGQGIEIEEPALTVVRLMDNVLEKLNAVKTGERGSEFVDEKSRSYGKFEVGGLSPTGALELMRGDLTEVLYKAADTSANVTYHFETTIQSLSQTADKVIVELENRQSKNTRTEEFDFVIGADGARSRTRQLVMGSPETIKCFKPIGAFIAYFSIPKQEQDWPYSRLCNYAGRRMIWTRPVRTDSKETSVYLIHTATQAPALSRANASGDRTRQKEAFAELFTGLGGEAPRVIEQMMKSENFYSDELVQVKLPKWSQGRVAIIGDAAWAPTPFTGEGNQLAIIGAWVLAQELGRNRSTVAFGKYEKRLRMYVENAQKIPLGGYAPYVFLPQTFWGVWLLRMGFLIASWISRFVEWTGVSSLLPNDDMHHAKFDLETEDAEPVHAR